MVKNGLFNRLSAFGSAAVLLTSVFCGGAIAQSIDSDPCSGDEFHVAGYVENAGAVCRFETVYSLEYSLADRSSVRLAVAGSGTVSIVKLTRYNQSGRTLATGSIIYTGDRPAQYNPPESEPEFGMFHDEIAELVAIAIQDRLVMEKQK